MHRDTCAFNTGLVVTHFGMNCNPFIHTKASKLNAGRSIAQMRVRDYQGYGCVPHLYLHYVRVGSFLCSEIVRLLRSS
jgi:hypothetical protein